MSSRPDGQTYAESAKMLSGGKAVVAEYCRWAQPWA